MQHLASPQHHGWQRKALQTPPGGFGSLRCPAIGDLRACKHMADLRSHPSFQDLHPDGTAWSSVTSGPAVKGLNLPTGTWGQPKLPANIGSQPDSETTLKDNLQVVQPHGKAACWDLAPSREQEQV